MKFKSNVELESLSNATTDTDKFVVSDSNILKYRTGNQLLLDIGAQAALTNPITGTGSSGQVSFFNGTTTQTGDNELFWNNSTKRLGIGNTIPSAKLDVSGDILVNGINIGRGAGNIDTNTAVGQNALVFNTTGFQNTALGRNALLFNTTGGFNTALGHGALLLNTEGVENTAVGGSALRDNTTGGFNTAVGRDALFNNTTGGANTAVGQSALVSNTTGANNTAVGQAALVFNTTGGFNTAVGLQALRDNTTGVSNIGLGFDAGRRISNGSAQTITNNSIFIGRDTRALADNQTNQIVIGHQAVGVGSNSVVLGNDSITKTILKGNVGIGTTSPKSNAPFGGLTLDGTNGGEVTFRQSGVDKAFSFSNGNNLFLGTSSTGYLQLFTNNTPKVTLQSSGNFSIGNTNNTYKLDVSGTGRFTSTVTAPTFSGALSGNAATATTWQTPRTLTIGNTGKSVNGGGNVSWSLAEIGAQASGNYVTLDTVQTITADKTFTGVLNWRRYGDQVHETVQHFRWGGSTDTNWKRVATLNDTVLTGWRAVSGEVVLYNFNGNHGQNIPDVYKARFYARFSENSVPLDTARLEGVIGGDDFIRIVKIDVRYWEVQVRQISGFRTMAADVKFFHRTGNNSSIETSVVPPDGGTGTVIPYNVITENFGNIISNGNVGIGTSSPTYRLQVGTTGGLADSIRIGSFEVAQNTRQYIGYARNDNGLFESSGNGDTPSTVLAGVAGIRIVNTVGSINSAKADNSIQLLTHIYNGGSRVALHARWDGNVGIGTTSPTFKLDVSGTGRFTDTLTVPILISTGNITGVKAFLGNGTDRPAQMKSTAGSRGIEIVSNDSVSRGGIDWNTSDFLIRNSSDGNLIKLNYSTKQADFYGNIINTGTITSQGTGNSSFAGNVGIGTTSPTYKLGVVAGALGTTSGDSLQALQLISTTSNIDTLDFKKIRTSNGADWNTAGWRIQQRIDVTNMGYVQFNGDGNIFGLSFGTVNTERMRITSAGNVGIGTISPSDKLDVDGGIRCRNRFIRTGNNLNQWAYHVNNGSNNSGLWVNGSNATELYLRNTSGTINTFLSGAGNSSYILGSTGIGTTSPSNKLHIDATSAGNYVGAIRVSNSGTTTNTATGIRFQVGTSNNTFGEIRGILTNNPTSGGTALTFATTATSSGPASERMRIDGLGNVGIGNTANLTGGGRLQVSGDIRTTGDVIAFSTSDQRLKNNLTLIPNSLEKITKLSGYSFEWNEKQDTYTGHDYGVIAQEVEALFPEMVQTRESGMKAVKYDRLIPVLIEAIKEQQKQIDELKMKIDGITN